MYYFHKKFITLLLFALLVINITSCNKNHINIGQSSETLPSPIPVKQKQAIGNEMIRAAKAANKKLLLETLTKLKAHEKVNINAIDKHGDTPLHQAIQIGKLNIVRALISNGADLNIKNKLQVTPLLCAIRKNYINTALELIKQEVNVNIPDKDGITPLHAALSINLAAKRIEYIQPVFGNCREFKLPLELLKKQADVNAKDRQGNTPLHIAAERKVFDRLAEYGSGSNIVTQLIKYGAKVNEKNNQEKTPLDIAIEKQHPFIVRTLGLRSGATIIKDENYRKLKLRNLMH